jgi:3-oxoadipate enol-lactonase
MGNPPVLMGVAYEMETKFVELRGIRFAYSETGSGPVVLRAHGLTSSRANETFADFSPVADAGFRLISYDARGHGESGSSAVAEDYSWPALAEDMVAIADHFSPDAPVSAIGLSMGTGTLLHAAVKHPSRFDKLVLSAPPTAWETRAGQVQLYSTMADTVENNGPEVLATLLSAAPIAPIFEGVEGFPQPPDVRHEVLPTVFRGAGLSDLPTLEQLGELPQPTLILSWATDPGHPVSTGERLVETIPDSVLRIAKTSADIGDWGRRAAEFLTI